MAEVKSNSKINKLMKWRKIKEVNKMLDNGESPANVCKWINRNGFKISHPMVYEYAKLRKDSLLNSASMTNVFNSAHKVLTNDLEQSVDTSKKLKSELDALDVLISQGYETLIKAPGDIVVGPNTLMKAIQLKAELTEGNHGFLTEYGLQELRELEAQKYSLILRHLLKYVPEKELPQVMSEIDDIEEDFYRGTDYYADYLRAKGLDEKEIKRRISKVEEDALSEECKASFSTANLLKEISEESEEKDGE